MSERGGWIKIHRKMLEWGWYSDPGTSRVFIHLLLLANFGEREFLGHKIHPGQAVITYGGMAEALGLSVKNVRTAIEHLESTHEIGRQLAGKFQIVTIEKWALYQLDDDEAGREVAGNRQGSGREVAGNRQHYKKERKEEIKNYSFWKDEKDERLSDYLDELRERKKQ